VLDGFVVLVLGRIARSMEKRLFIDGRRVWRFSTLQNRFQQSDGGARWALF
jgi:hypothetical protein